MSDDESLRAERSIGYKRALANVASILRLARERGGTVHLTRGAGYEEIVDEVDALIRLAVVDVVREIRRLAPDATMANGQHALVETANHVEAKYGLKS